MNGANNPIEVNTKIGHRQRTNLKKRFLRQAKRDFPLYLIALPGLISLIVFKYIPIYGIIIAFKNYNPGLGIFASKWVGFEHFIRFFKDPYFFRIFKNTFLLGFYTLLFSFPAPIILALLLNEVRNDSIKKIFQTISYLPNFISVVIVAGFIIDFTSMSDGIINDIIAFFGGERISFMAEPEWFRPIYIISGIWQGVGVGSIIYLAAISGINNELYESAYIDGAGRWKQMRYITLPCLMPTIAILLILSVGDIFGSDFTKILLLYRPLTYETADVISTYVFRMGIQGGSFSYSTAVGLFLSVISFIFLFFTDRISKKISDISLF